MSVDVIVTTTTTSPRGGRILDVMERTDGSELVLLAKTSREGRERRTYRVLAARSFTEAVDHIRPHFRGRGDAFSVEPAN